MQRKGWQAGIRTGVVVALCCSGVARAETAAGTVIVNVARLSYETAGQTAAINSNEHRTIVAERLDVALVSGGVTTLSDGTSAVAAILTHRGNGQEAFAIAATAAAGDGQILRLAIDSDGDGRYDPIRDLPLVAGRTPVLAPGQTLTLFAIVAGGTTGNVTITAAAATGAGAPGTDFPGAGDGGGDAVTGPTGARASVTVTLADGGPGGAPTLTKRATVAAPDGSGRAMRGATITYELEGRFPAATQAAQVSDPIPAGTAYVPASLTLDDAALSDAADADAGDATHARISVALGDQPAGAVRTIRFKVVIQ